MDFFIKVVFENYANFSGRARREEFWMFILFYTVFSSILNLVSGVFGVVGLLIMAVWSLGLLMPIIAVTIRRFHDSGKSGWWYLASFAPIIPAFIMALMIGSGYRLDSNAMNFVWVLFAISFLICLIPLVFLFLNSEPCANKWGSNPKEELAHHETPPPL